MITENLSTLKINKLTQEQYEHALAEGRLNENELYLTPYEEIDLSGYATIDQLKGKADINHGHEIKDIENLQVTLDEKVPTSRTINGKQLTTNISLSASDIGAATSDHTHDDIYYTKDEIDSQNIVVNTSITNITNGTTIVGKAANATNAETANVANSATKASKDGNDNVIVDTYETKTDSAKKLEAAKTYTDAVASGKADTGHNHDASYDIKGSSEEALKSAKNYIDEKVKNLTTDTIVGNKITSHDTSDTAHSDIRKSISDLSKKLDDFLDVNDDTTDQLSEVLTLIENNQNTLSSLTSDKVNVSDIVDNLTTYDKTKVLSANQGAVINGLIDDLQSEVGNKASATHSHTAAEVGADPSGSANEALNNAKDYTDELKKLVGALPEGTAATSVVNYVDIKTAGIATDAALEELQKQLSNKAEKSHNHDESYYTQTQIDTKLSGKSDTTHNHDSEYDSKGTASSAVSTHNTSTTAHNDIRELINGLTNRLNTLANSDDTTLDQMSEVVAYIKNNKSLIDGITTNKVNVADIINNLTTNVANKPLSAAQGVAIKELIDGLQTEVDGKADESHGHTISDVENLKATLDAKTNQNAFSNVKVGETTIAADSVTDTITLVAGNNVILEPNKDTDSITISSTYVDTTYSAGDGITLSGTTFSNSGVRNIETGSANGTISADINGTTIEIAVKGLGSAAYANTSAFDASGAANTALANAKAYTDTVASGKANTSHGHAIVDITNLQASLDGKAPTSRTINGKSLTENITLSASDVGADVSGSASSALATAKSYSDSGDATTLSSAKSYADNLFENYEFITINDIDTICGANIQAASEVTF